MNNIHINIKKFIIIILGCALISFIFAFILRNQRIPFSVIPTEGILKDTEYTVSIREKEESSSTTSDKYFNYTIKHPSGGSSYTLVNISANGLSKSDSQREYAVVKREFKSFLITKASCGMSEQGYCFQVYNISDPKNIKDLGITDIMCKDPKLEEDRLVFTHFEPKCNEIFPNFPWQEKKLYYIELS